jgi:hypothetical protein
MDMCHDVVPEPPFVLCDRVKIDLRNSGSHLRDCFFGDVDTKLSLGLCQGDPQFAPKLVPRLRGP